MKDAQKGDLTTGPITGNILFFALPLMCGNLLQQMYNIADTWVVGRFLGADALAAVGSSYALMVFLTSVILGLCMGSGAAVSMDYGSGRADEMRRSSFLSFVLDRRPFTAAQCAGLCFHQSDPRPAPRAHRCHTANENLSADYFRGYRGDPSSITTARASCAPSVMLLCRFCFSQSQRS